jgi:hypothetical protein
MGNICAVLLDSVSIQQYIFASNKLRENIGASFIIERQLYGDLLASVLESVLGYRPLLHDWDKENTELEPEFEVGYIGGGNALLFFKGERNEVLARQFIKEFSTQVLVTFPGLQPAFGLLRNFNMEGDYPTQFRLLHQSLLKNKMEVQPSNSIMKHGITADCPWSNDAAEILHRPSGKWISRSTNAKLEASEKAQSHLIQSAQFPCLGQRYMFTEQIDQLGQPEQGSYIAVVHVDGNGMGARFSQVQSLAELRSRSKSVSGRVVTAMNILVEQLIHDYEQGRLDDLSIQKDKNTQRIILPLRPILVGGDDITFVCEGRLGLYLAEKFVADFYHQDEDLMSGACAGVAIVKTHFPFYKVVQLAEELCKEAKKNARNANGACYISYYYSATTFSGSLEQLRIRSQKANEGLMYFGPYCLSDSFQTDSIEKLKDLIRNFKNLNLKGNSDSTKQSGSWPKNKIMRLREMIPQSPAARKLFEKELQEQGLKLPGSTTGTIWQNGQTMYFDPLELMDFYPDSLL